MVDTCVLEFWISFITTNKRHYQVNRDKPVVIGGGGQSNLRKPLSNPRSLATSSRARVGFNSDGGERQRTASGNVLNHSSIKDWPFSKVNIVLLTSLYIDYPVFFSTRTSALTS